MQAGVRYQNQVIAEDLNLQPPGPEVANRPGDVPGSSLLQCVNIRTRRGWCPHRP